MKVKIKKVPLMANGGNKITMGGFKYNQVVPNYIPNLLGEKPVEVVDTLSAVPVEQANVEAEQGETVVVPNQQGLSAHYKIGGKRHSEGGTPLDLPDDSFIFSDTKGMKIKDKKILEMFGESSPKTPAQIAKKYDINKQRKTLSDPLSDKLQKETAEKNIANFNYMLGKLALVQESMKGFPQGIPFIAQPYLMMNELHPMDVLPFEEIAKSPAKSAIPAPMSSYANEAEEEQEIPMDMMKSGGSVKVKIKGLPKAQKGLSKDSKTGDVIGLNKSFWDTYQAAGQQGLFQPDLPYQGQWDAIKRQRKETQGAVKTGNTKNVYGDLNWTEGPEWEDFKRRHQWYLKDNPDFDPHSKSDVENFQKAYIKKAEELGVDSSYFANEKTKGLGIDGLFGEHTWSAPGFNPAPKQPQTVDKETKDEVRSYNVPNVQEVPARDPFGYFPQDAARMFGIASQQIPNPQTFYAAATPEFMNPAYITEDYSPISEQTAIAAKALGTFGTRGGSQGLAANLSKIQGNTARQAADIALQVKNQNVGIYNNAEQFNVQTANANNQWNQVQKAQNFDTQQAYKANRIMAKNKRLADFINASIERENNAIQAYNLNITSPYFKVDPTTGGMVSFYNGKPIKPNEEAMASELAQLYKELKKLNMPEETIQRVIASKVAGNSKIHENEYMPDYSHMMYPFS